MHRIAILTLSIGDQYTRSIEPGLKSKLQYAQRWGYSNIVSGVEHHDHSRPLAWSKLGFWLSYLDANEYDFLWLSDADSIITNPEVSIEDIIDLVFEDKQIQGVWWEDVFGNKNSGQMLVRTKSAAVRQWLTEADSQQDLTDHEWWENIALTRVWDRNKHFQNVIRVRTDYKLINAYLGPSPEKNWTPSCFVLHYAGLKDRFWIYCHMITVARPDLADFKIVEGGGRFISSARPDSPCLNRHVGRPPLNLNGTGPADAAHQHPRLATSDSLQIMSTINETFAAALRHHQAGNLELAEGLFQQVLSVDPNHADSLHFLGLIDFARGQNGAASEFMRRAVSLQPNDVLLLVNFGNALQAQGKLNDAVVCYNRALELQPDHVVTHYNLAGALLSLGKTREAIACYHRALHLQPELYQAYHNLGQAHQGQFELEKAVTSYRRALELKPNLEETHLCLGNVLFVQHKFAEAIECYQRALALQPNSAQARTNLAAAFLAQGNSDGMVVSRH
jgi:tetratricopeptide (TPR) repeat protein